MTTTTATAPARQRQPRPKPARNISLRIRPEGSNAGVVRITVGRAQTDYFLTEMAADFGRGFRVEKVGLEGGPAYHVNLDGDRRTCDCQGHARHGHCRHADGLAALLAAGRL